MVRARWSISVTLFAVALFTVALTAMPTAPPNLSLALETQQRLVADHPSDAKARNDLGNLLVAAGRYEEAETAYLAALDLTSTDPAVHFNLAVLYQQTGRSKKAQQHYRALLDLDERNAWAHYQLGVLLEQRGQRSQAIEHYARAFAYDEGLTFAKNNPHLIENRLVTEALLESRRFREKPGAHVPRQYGEAARIRSLMLDVGSLTGDTPATPAHETPVAAESSVPPTQALGAALDEDEDEPDAGGRALTHADLTDSKIGQAGTTGSARRNTGSPGYRPPTAPTVPASPGASPQYRRPVRPPTAAANRSGIATQEPVKGEPLGGTVVGSAPTGGDGSTPQRPTVGRAPVARPGAPLVSPNPGSPARSSRRSTSQLDLRLLPEREPAARYARLEPGAPG